jgi:homoserine dehydrogenase
MVTHVCPERAVTDALDRLDGSQSITGRPMLMHILDV